MGTIKQGILGGFSGKVGTVVGGSWKGISYMRGQAQSVKNPRTDAQLSQRTKFALALNFLKPMTSLVRVGFKLYAHRQTPFNAAMSYNLANAISGAYPDYELQYASALVSKGNLTPPANASAAAGIDSVTVSWNDNSGVGTAKQTDRALIAVLNPSKAEAITETAGAERTEETQTLIVPADWLNDEVQVYLGFISEDGKEVSNSCYLGNFVIA